MDRLSDFNSVYTDKPCEFYDARWLTLAEDMNIFGISTDSEPPVVGVADQLTVRH